MVDTKLLRTTLISSVCIHVWHEVAAALSHAVMHRPDPAACAGENEANINFVLQRFKDMQLVPQTPHLAGPGLSGYYMHEDGYREDWLLPAQAQLVQRFDPCSSTDTIGFFIAKLRKSP